MAPLVACLLFFFLFPCLSNPCTPILPCNHSIQINPPFFLQSDISINSTCWSQFPVGCDSTNNTSFVVWHSSSFPLESISYGSNITRIQDPYLVSSLKESGCSNLYFNFSIPINVFDHPLYKSLNDSLFSLRCEAPNQIHMPPTIFEQDYNLSYSPSRDVDNKSPENCLRPDDSVPNFEFILSFESGNRELSLLSATYSNERVAQPGCFAYSTEVRYSKKENSTEVSNCEGCKEKRFQRRIIIVSTMAGIIIIIIVFLLSFRRKIQPYWLFRKNREQEKIVSIIKQHGSFAPVRYKYAELKKITNSFHNKLGKGGFGSVFKGNLRDGRFVAVKLLHDSSGTGEEFVNEVISIGRTSHANIVGLIGFCIEKSYRALIYEYMPNGSLDKYIYSENTKDNLKREKLYDIAVGVARGLEYLHWGCSTRIVHFDIKPQNILLDEDFCPKIADFGLAKLCPPKESILSLAEMRGTIGYIAPEVFSRSFGVVSTKSDVYSFGMMVLEMVGGKTNVMPSSENSSQEYFPHWIYDRLAKGADIDACNATTKTEELARKMALVGLWCTQSTPANRPSMGRVLELFERRLDELEMPPKPYLASPHRMMLSICSSNS